MIANVVVWKDFGSGKEKVSIARTFVNYASRKRNKSHSIKLVVAQSYITRLHIARKI